MDDRPAKRARIEEANDLELPVQPRGHDFGDVVASGSAPVHLGDNTGVQNHYYYQRDPARGSIDNDEAKHDMLFKSLLFTRMDARVNNISKALYNSCIWLFRHRSFRDWHSNLKLHEHNGFLWIKGKPGCGKSTIMKRTLEWAQTRARKDTTSRKVVYYFFNARASSSLEKSTLGLYRFLVYQILDLYPALRAHFMTKFAHKDPERSDDEWTRNELQDFLSDLVHVGVPCSLYVLIDALDEGEEQVDVRDMINFLVGLSESALGPGSALDLRVCLSSRHYPHISIGKGLSITLEDQAEHDLDIETYVRRQLIRRHNISSSGTVSREELIAEVCRRSAGIFLWVVLVIRLLHEVEDRGGPLLEMTVLLRTIPNDLNQLFERIIAGSHEGIESCVALLQWVLFAARALRPDELYLATECSLSPADPAWAQSSEIEVPQKDRLLLYILHRSRGLVELTNTRPPVVQFIHETVRDYLSCPGGLVSLLPASSNNFLGQSHEVLKTSCARYISRSQIPVYLQKYIHQGYANNDDLEYHKNILCSKLRFIHYSICHIFEHAEQAQIHGISQTRFLQDRTGLFGIWQGAERLWRNVFERFTSRKYGSDVTLLYYLADQGMLNLLRECTMALEPAEASEIVNQRCGRYKTALSAACMNGNEDSVRVLATNGANINDPGSEYGHALLTAVYSKNYPLIAVLQNLGATISPALLSKALFEIITRGSVQGVTELLRLGADMEWLNLRGQTTLQVAWNKRHPQLFNFLLRTLRLNAPRLSHEMGHGQNLLVHASRMGYNEVVRYLIDSGADLNERDVRGNSALQQACCYGHIDTARLLIERGADVDAGGLDDGQTALMACRGHCRLDLLRLLIDNGADVNKPDALYESLLQSACAKGHNEVIRLLVECGADVNVQGGMVGSPLYEACYTCTTETVQLLLKHGADINARSWRRGSALQVPANRGRLDLVRLLIENGADVNARGGYYGNALQAACYAGHLDIAQLLLGHSADVNIQGGNYGTALQAACDRGHLEVAQLLIEKGADVNAKPVSHSTALMTACANGFADVARLLIESGADVNAQGGEYHSALHSAVLRRDATMVQVLIEKGADVTQRSLVNGLTALSAIEEESIMLPFLTDDIEPIKQILRDAQAVHVIVLD